MKRNLKAGDQVQVRSAAEILATLDERGCLDELPFMPEMLGYIGKQFRVSKRAHKTCDTVHQTGGRRMRDCVHLEDQRCSGDGHDGCKATCLLFWKDAWLKPAAGTGNSNDANAPDEALADLEALVNKNVKHTERADGSVTYCCQATALYDATQPLPWYDLRQYAEDLTSGNAGPLHMLRVWLFHGLHKLAGLGIGYRLWRSLYDALQSRVGGYKYPFRSGKLPNDEKTPVLNLDLQPGERVRVRQHDDILQTVNLSLHNRGMRFDPEMVPYCGKTYTVARRVDRIIHETTGKMLDMKSPSVILDGVVCRSEMSACRLFCPRAIPSYWREIWLERVDDPAAVKPDRSTQAAG